MLLFGRSWSVFTPSFKQAHLKWLLCHCMACQPRLGRVPRTYSQQQCSYMIPGIKGWPPLGSTTGEKRLFKQCNGSKSSPASCAMLLWSWWNVLSCCQHVVFQLLHACFGVTVAYKLYAHVQQHGFLLLTMKRAWCSWWWDIKVMEQQAVHLPGYATSPKSRADHQHLQCLYLVG